ncbi:hypothetical protein K9O30_14430 [Clostridium bowmanii]|nr:hypothetical protein [Clostridium bowmanii]MBU3190385.1 hypothetical protein [Clostridium bowmanii]MCA1074897.1 hypothetical protein [Clostridium bowmanii]
MDYEVLKTITQEIRDKYLKEELGEEKSRVIDKYCLTCNENLYWQRGFIETEIYNMEFIKHKSTGIVIALRNLCNIDKIEEFIKLCNYLENRDVLEKDYIIQGLD